MISLHPKLKELFRTMGTKLDSDYDYLKTNKSVGSAFSFLEYLILYSLLLICIIGTLYPSVLPFSTFFREIFPILSLFAVFYIAYRTKFGYFRIFAAIFGIIVVISYFYTSNASKNIMAILSLIFFGMIVMLVLYGFIGYLFSNDENFQSYFLNVTTPNIWKWLKVSAILIAFVFFFLSVSKTSSYFSSLISHSFPYVMILIALGGLYALMFLTKKGIYDTTFKNDTLINKILRLVRYILLYLPCSLVEILNAIFEDINVTPKATYFVLIGIIVFSIIYIQFNDGVSFLQNLFITNEKVIFNGPVYLDGVTTVGKYEDYLKMNELENKKDPEFDYALSSWIYLNADQAGQEHVVFNFDNKPKISYKHSTNTMIVEMKTHDETTVSVKIENIPLQKWNHLVVNVKNNITDIFINNEYVISLKDAIPYDDDYGNIEVGDNNGIQGGICNIMYFDTSLSKVKINELYHTYKNRNPPTY
jgi:hypothetical protein